MELAERIAEGDELLTPAEVARLLRVSVRTVRRWIRPGFEVIPVHRIRMPGSRSVPRILRSDALERVTPGPGLGE